MNVLIAGVGGQGTLLASRILGKLAEARGSDCKLNEVHGMAQRGGSVVTHVKIAEKVYSPVIAEGDADFILAFEMLEALRYCGYLKKDGIIIVNTQKIMPMPVITGAAAYPDGILGALKSKYNVVAADALSAAVEAGNVKAVNTVILGCFAGAAGIPYDEMERALSLSVKPKLLEVNKAALEKGYALVGRRPGTE
ncbi:MAG: indolepyruvate oxidoreductase subunit beta [Clostridiales bacterium]|jgi:indolepyruvate ferredoxin oxidoreductase beta subunit|nr:indolepyruvate oxidoreductase subunit beta [Clostridiales bacterium]